MKKETKNVAALAVANTSYPCLCAFTRKAGRALTKKYDAYLKPSGLKITQYSMMANIARNPDIAVSALAELMMMEQTTVTRNLGVLEKVGLIHMERDSGDRRIKRVHTTEKGAAKLTEARPLWDRAQTEMENSLGKEGITNLLEVLQKLIQ